MNNKQINRHLVSFAEVRQAWIEQLSKDPGSNTAPQHILQINAKMELLRSFWNWSDESVEMAVVR